MGPTAGGGAAGRRGPSRSGVVAAALVAVAAALWTLWPSLTVGFHIDDYIHLALLQDHDVLPDPGPLEMYAFALPEAQQPERMGPVQGDYLPWFRDEDLLVRFCRPLTSLTYRLDRALHGDDPVGFHVSNLAWYAALVAACTVLFAALARVGGQGAVTVAAAGALFAVLREHDYCAAWIAGRYTVVGALFCPLGLLAHHRWRTTGLRSALVGSLAALALGLLATEMLVVQTAYLLAYELTLGRGGARERLRALAPAAAVVAVWLAAYVALGYGVRHSSDYIDPTADLGRFVAEGLGVRGPRQLARLVLPAASEAGVGPGMPWPLLSGVGGGWETTAVLLAAFVLHACRDRASRFALLGALLALVPLVGAPPAPRILILPSVGMAWVTASFVARSLADLRSLRSVPGAVPRLLAAAVAAFLVLGSVQEPFGVRQRIETLRNVAAGMRERALELDVPADPDVRLVLVTTPTVLDAQFGPFVRLERGLGWPGAVWPISTVWGTHVLERTGERSFALRASGAPNAPGGGLLLRRWAGLFRADLDLAAGDVFANGALRVAVLEADAAGNVLAVEVTIDRPLDDPDVWLVAWEEQAWRRLAPPAVGESVEIDTRFPRWDAPLALQRPGRRPGAGLGGD